MSLLNSILQLNVLLVLILIVTIFHLNFTLKTHGNTRKYIEIEIK